VSLDAVARKAHLSKFHFLRLFRERFHETPIRYLRRRRLEAAQRLLARTELPVTHICLRVGFESLGSFSSLFRESVGVSPSSFRRRYVAVPRSIIAPERLIPGCWIRRYQFPSVVATPNFPTQQF
jgi:AraC-like DNA-binding protein